MKTLSTLDVIKIVYFEYIKKIKLIRLCIVPLLFCMIIGRIMEVKVTELVQIASKEFTAFEQSNIFIQYLSVVLISSLLIELQGFIFCSCVQRAARISVRNIVQDYFKMKYPEFKKKGLGEISLTVDRRSSSVAEILDVLILNFLPVSFVISLAIYKIYSVLGFASSFVITLSLISYTLVTIRMATWRNDIRKRLNLSNNLSRDKMMDMMTNYDSLIAFNNQNYECERFDEKLKANEKLHVKLWRTFYLLNFLQRFIFCLQNGMIIYIGLRNHMPTDEFVLYLSINQLLSSNLDKLGYMYSRFTSAIVNAKMSHIEIIPQKQLYPIRYFNKCIRLNNVTLSHIDEQINDSFGYENIRESIFYNLNFAIHKGEKIALIGFNGVGKSTFLKMFLKFNEYSGSIRIDDDELNTIDTDSIRQMISYIPQDSNLISGTVKENLLYGNHEENESEMINLCKKLDYHESFMKLSAGYETFIGKNNTILSGGEKQKIAIVRAFLKDSEIYIFDEPSSNLDKKSEILFFDYLFEAKKDKTALVIVHNMDLIKKFDKIAYLTKNEIKIVSQEEAIILINQKEKIKLLD